MTQEFHLSATPVGQNHYLLRTEQVAPGVPLAEELLHWPVTEWLAIAGYLMDDPLQLVLQGEMNDKNAPNLVELGRELYNALFQKSLRDSWITAQGIAQNHQQVLRLRLGLKDPSLARLPWEVMHAGDSYGALRYRPLVTGPDITFARYQCGTTSVNAYWLRCLQTGQRSPNLLQTHNFSTPAAEQGLKVLMVISSPRNLVQLNLLKQEAINLKAELHRQGLNLADGGHHRPKIEAVVLDQPGREELTQALEQGHYDILHYSGHSNLGANGGQIYLVSKKTGLTETLSGDDLAGLLINNHVQMVVFNSCFGSYGAKAGVDEVSGEGNLTECLVKRGIRSVLAMSERIPDEVALTLTQLFYRNLSQGYALDLCVSRVRQGLISTYGSQQMYWALPILYLQREFDGCLTPQVNLSGHIATSPRLSDLLNEYQPPGQTNHRHYAAVANNPENLMADDDVLSADLTEETTEVDWLLADSWGDFVDEIEYDDSNYDQDSAIVSDLFRQLDKGATTGEGQSMKAELIEESQELPEMQVSEVQRNLNWGNVPTSITPTSLNIQKRQVNPPLSPTPLVSSSNRYHKSRSSFLLLGLVSLITMILGVAWWWYQRQSQQHFLPNIPPLPGENISSNQYPINLANSATGIVTATATAQLSQGNLKDGLIAIHELLNRGALTAAETALNLIPVQDTQNPAVSFAWGRLAWQSVQTGNNKYGIDDARRYWAKAVQSQPDSTLYKNALGFAYYEEHNLNYANDAWFKSLNLALQPQQNTEAKFGQTKYPQISREPEALTAYAGLALGLYKSAQSQPSDKRQKYLQEAIKLRQMVIQNAPADFTIEKLSQNWLWTQQAIADWQSLGQTKLPLL
ncbi:CHAT domain-containing protein [Dolichospermum circinale CS-534/05]|uniref:cell division protein HetF n=1 Tax=Dolichospermum circinale TaxID=109265 RepID=UPI0023309258|nr:cell division protein HetF [Dolichospermum circinale]MDB9456683.1 CHAT domain-containing protein [Dolichospermum circinale CS-541/06]MDB9462249.1 CHAT domain-containing protein [Dolichospermum circinale CS-541/04]MDB9490368.1 CHAT domain-containing protein [Dolichospermum circinale CS-534/05]MDB9548000.1 CHAT domain-containing protein [Dolichospermum circinale CS-1031]